jgi:redox-sensitive bicupin YhaK (pirin superfamily)
MPDCSAPATGVALAAPTDAPDPLSVLLIDGLPLHEPFVRYGPFVMNTEAEIRQALLDYQSGRMGAIAV